MVEFPMQGHVIPLLELAQVLATHGIRTTFVNTEMVHDRVVSSFAGESLVGLEPRERYVPGKLTEAVYTILPGKVQALIREINCGGSKISCLVYDQSIGSLHQVARDAGHRSKLILDMMRQNNHSINSADWVISNSALDLEPGASTLAPQIRKQQASRFRWPVLPTRQRFPRMARSTAALLGHILTVVGTRLWRVGLQLGRDSGVIVPFDEIKEKIDRVVGDEELKGRALQLKEMMGHGTREGGTSYQNLKNFITWLHECQE
ncbi:hypothetical protein SASPL_114413 [Salvia splendens]|uniref:Uncharacterized protein n=1 Tax=Salvia splendens TaxID=180675 RepID=A0A8X9A206_SALSN|nr:hypothetical protein SASPL_114413 [Salvia splendens]